MASRGHSEWLRLFHDGEERSVVYSSRLETLVRTLIRPRKQYPSLIHFIGKNSKVSALRALYPSNSFVASCEYGLARLHLDLTTKESTYPILLAESNPERGKCSRLDVKQLRDNCHESDCYQICQEGRDANTTCEDVSNEIYSRLIIPFIDVLCLFVDDFGGFDALITVLAAWEQLDSAKSPNAIRPRIIVVTKLPKEDEALKTFQLRWLAVASKSFSSCTVLSLSTRRGLSVSARYAPLREGLLQEAQIVRDIRLRQRHLFSGTHLKALHHRAMTHFRMAMEYPFDFITASREDNSVGVNFAGFLKLFLRLCRSLTLPDQRAHSFIASAILLDAFPPNMHRFEPRAVFNKIYQKYCLKALIDLLNAQSADMACRFIEAQFVAFFNQMEGEKLTSQTVHRRNLEVGRQDWSQLKTAKLCLFCLRRKPEHILDCEHAVCDACVCIFGETIPNAEYHYQISRCILCQSALRVKVRLLPPTAHPVLLSIDGGGIRGVIPLEFLKAVEDAIDLPCPVQEHFDIALGTSSGALILLGLFSKNWRVRESISLFDQLARRLFPTREYKRGSFITHLCTTLKWYLADSRYDAGPLEACFREVFGWRRLFDVATPRFSGVKIAVTTSRTTDATICLITNYNGYEDNDLDHHADNGSDRYEDFGYKHLRPPNFADEVLVWEACATAAPGFFTPKHLPAFAPLQDGGVKQNNPLGTALGECRVIWPSNGEPDMVISIGTGYTSHTTSPKTSKIRDIVKERFPSRLFRASMTSLSLDGQTYWRDHRNKLEDKKKPDHVRLNLPLEGAEPAIDEVNKMEELRVNVRNHLRTNNDVALVTRGLFSTKFYFELDEKPIFSEGLYRCYGSILCRSLDSHALITRITREWPRAQFVTDQDVSFGRLRVAEICEICGCYRKGVVFSVQKKSDTFTLSLVFNRKHRRKINGSFSTVSWVEEQQKLEAPFGRSDHREVQMCPCRRWQNSSLWSKSVRKKRDPPFDQATAAKKKSCTAGIK